MKKSTIALIVAAFVCLGLSVFSVKASVVRTNDAIQNIGEVTYTEESKAKIDRAVKYYNALDPNFDLKKKIKNMNVTEAREVIDSYLTADQYTLIENYADLIELESEYTSTGSSGGSSEEVSIPMC